MIRDFLYEYDSRFPVSCSEMKIGRALEMKLTRSTEMTNEKKNADYTALEGYTRFGTVSFEREANCRLSCSIFKRLHSIGLLTAEQLASAREKLIDRFYPPIGRLPDVLATH